MIFGRRSLALPTASPRFGVTTKAFLGLSKLGKSPFGSAKDLLFCRDVLPVSIWEGLAFVKSILGFNEIAENYEK